MKANFKFLFIALVICSSAFSQGNKFKIFLKQTNWTFGLGNSVVVDGGKEATFPFEFKAWNYVPFPNRLTLEGDYKKGWSFQTEFVYNQYKAGNIVDKIAIAKPATFFGSDFIAKFAFSHWVGKSGWFDPYVTAGIGYTYRSGAVNIHTGTNNVGLGCNFWIYKGFGLNLQGMGKFVMKGGAKSNYTNYSATIVYKLLGSKRSLGESK